MLRSWKTFSLMAAMFLTLTQVGCVLAICNVDPSGDPVVLDFDPDSIDNDNDELAVGECDVWSFDVDEVDVNGFNPIVPESTDDITVALIPGVTVIHWDGSVFVEGLPPTNAAPNSRAGESKQ